MAVVLYILLGICLVLALCIIGILAIIFGWEAFGFFKECTQSIFEYYFEKSARHIQHSVYYWICCIKSILGGTIQANTVYANNYVKALLYFAAQGDCYKLKAFFEAKVQLLLPPESDEIVSAIVEQIGPKDNALALELLCQLPNANINAYIENQLKNGLPIDVLISHCREKEIKIGMFTQVRACLTSMQAAGNIADPALVLHNILPMTQPVWCPTEQYTPAAQKATFKNAQQALNALELKNKRVQTLKKVI